MLSKSERFSSILSSDCVMKLAVVQNINTRHQTLKKHNIQRKISMIQVDHGGPQDILTSQSHNYELASFRTQKLVLGGK